MSARTDVTNTVQLIHFGRATSRTVLRVRGLSGLPTRCEEIFEARSQEKVIGDTEMSSEIATVQRSKEKKAASLRALCRQRPIWVKKEK